jgi:hypothetical protein
VLRGLPATDPVEDLRALFEGHYRLIVGAFRYEDGRWRRGRLTLDAAAADPIIWRKPRNAREPLTAPIDVEAVRPITTADNRWIKARLFRIITAYSGGQLWRLAVPTVDVELMRAAIGHTNSTGRPRTIIVPPWV